VSVFNGKEADLKIIKICENILAKKLHAKESRIKDFRLNVRMELTALYRTLLVDH
jgi:hypothetical protein